MELKDYQCRALDALRIFLDQAAIRDHAAAYNAACAVGKPLQRQKAELEERLAQDTVNVPNQYPNIVMHYRRNVERFTEVLDDPDEGGEAV